MEPDPQNSGPRRVEAYLDTVLASLPRRLSAFERDELRRELRTHLWERVAAYEELGQTEDDAVTEALTQFGGGKNFVKQWRREWTKPIIRLTLREVCRAGRQAWVPCLISLAASLVPFVLVFVGACLAIGTSLGPENTPPGSIKAATSFAFFWTMTSVTFLAVPIWLGTKHRRQHPQNAGVGIAAALAAQLAAACLVFQFADRLLPAGSFGRMAADCIFGMAVALLSVWLPLASGAAALTGWWTRRAEGRGMKIAPYPPILGEPDRNRAGKAAS